MANEKSEFPKSHSSSPICETRSAKSLGTDKPRKDASAAKSAWLPKSDGNFASKMNRFHCFNSCKLKVIWNRTNIILYCCLIGWNSFEVPFCPSFLKINIKLKSTVMNIILYYLHLVCELCHRTVILPLFHEFSRPSAWDLGGGHWPSKVNFHCIVNSDGAATPLSNLFLTMFKKDSTF